MIKTVKHKVKNLIGDILYRSSAKYFLAYRHRMTLGAWPSLGTPATFNEKLLLYKLNNRHNIVFARLADKLQAKDYVSRLIGKQYTIPTLWYGSNAHDIPFDDLRAQPWVIKSTHGSGQVMTITDPGQVDKQHVIAEASRWLATQYGRENGEWYYLAIEPRVLIEPLVTAGGNAPDDYKFYVFSGRVKMIHVDMDRFTSRKQIFYDRYWKPLNISRGFPKPDRIPELPSQLEKMIEIAEALAVNLEYARVDLYLTDEGIKFGEITLTPGAGLLKYTSPGADKYIGSLWETINQPGVCAGSHSPIPDASARR